jgi:hypothetical protein
MISPKFNPYSNVDADMNLTKCLTKEVCGVGVAIYKNKK